MKTIRNRIKIPFSLFLKVSIITLLTIFCFLKINNNILNNYLFIFVIINLLIFNFDIYKRKVKIKLLKLIGISKTHILFKLFVEYVLVMFVEFIFVIVIAYFKNINAYSILYFMFIQYIICVIVMFVNINHLLKKKREVMMDE